MATVESDGGGSGTRTVFPCAAFVIPGFHATSFPSFASVLLRLCQHSIAPTLRHSRIIQSSTNLVYIMIPAPRLCLLPPVLSLFAENQLKCLSMNRLHSKWVVPKQGQSSLIKPNQSILLCSPHRTNGSISRPFAEALHFAFCISCAPSLHFLPIHRRCQWPAEIVRCHRLDYFLKTMTRRQVLDLYFVEARSKLIDVASFLDRAQRADGTDDFRLRSFRAALSRLRSRRPDRARRVLLSLSDPTTQPIPAAGNKSACGAWPGKKSKRADGG